MLGIVRFLGWMRFPVLAVGCVSICLLVGGMGAFARQSQPTPLAPPAAHSSRGVLSAHTPRSTPDCTAVACIALTFDDGPDSTITPAILRILQHENVPATFFLVGREVPGREQLVRSIYAAGHEIGNHSWDHADFTKLPPVAIRAQIMATDQAIIRAGVPAPAFFRPPYGAMSPAVRAHVDKPIIRWDVDTEDWLTQDAAKISDHVVVHSHPGAIILMHDRYPATTVALQHAIPVLKQRYRFVTVSQLLGLTPGDQGQFFSR